MIHKIKISVRHLVEFIFRSGSIDSRFSGFDRANEGSRIHRKLQKQGGKGYKAEVALSITTQHNNIAYTVEGRADGIIEIDNKIIIDEIKTTAAPSELITIDFNRVHWAQAMCYAYIYCTQNKLETICVQITYFQIDTEEIKRFLKEFTFDQLNEFYLDLLNQYEIWAILELEWIETRNNSIKNIKFPFHSYRKGQRELAVAVYRIIENKGRLFCQAPTGIGKTISTLFPAVKAMGEKKVEKIFYLTAKTITRQSAEEAVLKMKKDGLKMKIITLTAKDKICFLEERNCTPENCIYADGYYDRIRSAIYEIIGLEYNMTREVIEKYSKKHCVCPYEMSLDLAEWCDCIICDYNYLFDPVVYLRRFFSDNKREYVFLIDEAHNLVDRARSMYSAQLMKSDFLKMKKLVSKKEKALYRSLTKVNSEMIAMRKLCSETGFIVQEKKFEDFNYLLYQLAGNMSEYIEKHKEDQNLSEYLQIYFDIRFYIKISELYDERFVSYVVTAGNEVYLKLLCIDPSYILDNIMKHGKSAVLFSATLSPLNYFSNVLGGNNETKKYALPSPFCNENLCLLVADHISTKYNDRDRSLKPISELLFELAAGKRGNYIIYFPSYKYMNDVYETFSMSYPQVETLIQTNNMDEISREEFLKRFDSKNNNTLIGFCVLGGIYSEGIDLKGDRLIGTAIVGVGLPQINTEQDILRNYFEHLSGTGYEYAYQFPGMNKVLQAAGRVIRSENDKGIVLLIDSRFSSITYQNLFPKHWQHFHKIRSINNLNIKMKDFWGKV